METTHKSQKADLPKYSKPPQVAKALPKYIKDIKNWKKNEWDVKGDGKTL